MHEITVNEFPFVAELPKREKSKVAKAWEFFQELREVVRAHGAVIPLPLAAELVGVSRTRVSQLAHQGRFECVEIHGHLYLTEESVIAFAKSERVNGRHLKAMNGGKGRLAAVKWAVEALK